MHHHEQTSTIDGVKISYLFQPAKQDRKHLVIIFSGFGSKSSISYDFIGESAQSCRSNILWIKDSFNEECSYYLNTIYSDKVEAAIFGLISDFIIKLGINKNQCTLVGFSKGGTAALYYGLKFEFSNILASCPQFHIGSYVKNNWPLVANNILKNGNVDYFDNLLPDLLKVDSLTDKNIYLISSPNDLQYSSEIEPYLPYFYKYSNFNFIFTKSKLAWQHNKVTRYNLPIILSILYAHGEGIRPKFGLINNDEPSSSMDSIHLRNLQEKNEVVSELFSCSIENGLLHIKGVSFIKGYECQDYSKIKHTLILSGKNSCYKFPLGKNINKEINYIYFENVYCDYSSAEFTTPGHKGIDISNIQRDVYTLYIEVECAGIIQTKKLETKKRFNTSYLIDGDECYLGSFEGNISIHRKDLLEEDECKVFEVSSKWHKGSLLHYEGIFAIKGINISNWGDASYYLILKNESNTYPFRIGMTELNNSSGLFKDTNNIYKKSYFSTLGRKGVDISKIPQGNYDIFICMSHQGKTFSQKVPDVLKWDGREITFTFDLNSIKSIAVIGSCVTRDNFNTKFNNDYKERYQCSTLQNQSSIVSIMSPSVSVHDDCFSDLDQWSEKDTLRDFRKEILHEIEHNKPDVIIFDMFTDARFLCLKVDDSFVTLNEWKLEKSNHYNKLINNERVGFSIDENMFLSLFKESIIRLKEFLTKTCPDTKIVLHSARGVDKYLDKDELKDFNSAFVNTLNQRWAKLDNLFIEVFSPIVIDLFSGNKFFGDAEHPWGCSMVHYQKNYYNTFISELNKVLQARSAN